MPKSKFAELIVPADPALPARITGMTVCSDYTDNGRRHIFLRRQEPELAAAVPAKRKPAKRKPAVRPAAPEPATAFPGAEAARG